MHLPCSSAEVQARESGVRVRGDGGRREARDIQEDLMDVVPSAHAARSKAGYREALTRVTRRGNGGGTLVSLFRSPRETVREEGGGEG